ncbi:hypothetical protein UFOVP191_4 [uncultured Caudovirales phage]|uniref:Uncharacterized protein n=1 Tax=uncultured Caudovirales phage TaxID=2100421 RepID=A0A6J7WG40_9CAUD|nr:hypothetical protein UFOVP191_4 [uncultured Caudovirales phage]
MSSGIINGNTFASYIISGTLTPAATATITAVEQTFTSAPFNQLKVGDFVSVNPPSITTGVGIVGARVSAAGTLAITFVNPTAGSLTAPSGTYVVSVLRPEANIAKTSIVD